MNPYYPRRFLSIDTVFKRRFGAKTVKIPLNAGFGCPNRDGTKGTGGCIYCSASLSGDYGGDPSKSLKEQFESLVPRYVEKWGHLGELKYIAYLQAGTNTYASPERLKAVYDEVVSIEGISGVSIATRADCISPRAAELLKELSKRTYLTVELGLQSSNERTAKLINRCHSYTEFLRGYETLRQMGIDTCVHIINGLPGETREDMLKTAKDVAALAPYEVKIHLLYIVAGTAAHEMYKRGEIKTLEMDEYISIVCDQLEVLPPETAIGRLTGDCDRSVLIAPQWSVYKRNTLNGIEKELKRRGSYQGVKYDGKAGV